MKTSRRYFTGEEKWIAFKPQVVAEEMTAQSNQGRPYRRTFTTKTVTEKRLVRVLDCGHWLPADMKHGARYVMYCFMCDAGTTTVNGGWDNVQ